MKIEAGKYYKTRDGRKVGPIKAYNASYMGAHPFEFHGMLFNEYGVGYRGDYPHQDIIEEWSDAPAETRVTTHATWSPRGQKPKTQYVYEVSFDLDANGHPDWSTATVRGK